MSLLTRVCTKLLILALLWNLTLRIALIFVIRPFLRVLHFVMLLPSCFAIARFIQDMARLHPGTPRGASYLQEAWLALSMTFFLSGLWRISFLWVPLLSMTTFQTRTRILMFVYWLCAPPLSRLQGRCILALRKHATMSCFLIPRILVPLGLFGAFSTRCFRQASKCGPLALTTIPLNKIETRWSFYNFFRQC